MLHRGSKPRAGAPDFCPQTALACTPKTLRTGIKDRGKKANAGTHPIRCFFLEELPNVKLRGFIQSWICKSLVSHQSLAPFPFGCFASGTASKLKEASMFCDVRCGNCLGDDAIPTNCVDLTHLTHLTRELQLELR